MDPNRLHSKGRDSKADEKKPDIRNYIESKIQDTRNTKDIAADSY